MRGGPSRWLLRGIGSCGLGLPVLGEDELDLPLLSFGLVVAGRKEARSLSIYAAQALALALSLLCGPSRSAPAAPADLGFVVARPGGFRSPPLSLFSSPSSHSLTLQLQQLPTSLVLYYTTHESKSNPRLHPTHTACVSLPLCTYSVSSSPSCTLHIPDTPTPLAPPNKLQPWS